MGGTTERPRARKRFGQHFLEPVWARKVIAAVGPKPDEVFLEIGPGPGILTRLLADGAAAVVAVEIDRDLASSLRAARVPRVHVVERDFLNLPIDELRLALSQAGPAATRWRVAGNLPYNVASPIMFRLLELSRAGLGFSDATIMLQREVADRLLAEPGTRDYGLLTVLIGYRASVHRLLNLPPGAFRPVPAVQSSVVRLEFRAPASPVADERLLADLTAAVFSRRRKTLANALLAFPGLTATRIAKLLAGLDIDPQRRPETLYIDELTRLASAVGSSSS
jgi:16S rRNA (adenine1518-N6/adenine1519-N6)-dimethyltransferase